MATLHSGASVPLYQQLYHTIYEQIVAGKWNPGDKIPSEGQLCSQYGVSRVTVRAAIEKLAEDGLLIKRHGKGTYVAMPVFVETMAGGSFTKSCLQSNTVPHTEVRSISTVPAPEAVALALQVEEGESVHQVCRIRFTDGVAVIYEVDFFRQQDTFVLEADIGTMPMSEIISSRTGLFIREFKDMFDVSPANEDQAKVFDCPVGTPLLLVQQVVMGDGRQILYYNEQYILSQRYRYVVSYS